MSYTGHSDYAPIPIKQNWLSNNEDYENKNVICSSVPLYVYLSVSSKCNMNPRCRMCLTESRGEFIDPIVLGRLKESLFKRSLHVILSVDGEPTIHPEFEDILDSIDGYVSLQTNGMKPLSFYERIIPKLHYVRFSIDAATAGTFKLIRNDRFEHLLDVIKLAVRLRDEQNLNLIVTLDYVVMQLNKHEMIDFCKLAIDLGVDNIMFTPIHELDIYPNPITVDGHVFDYKNELIFQEEYRELVAKCREFMSNYPKIKVFYNVCRK